MITYPMVLAGLDVQ